MLESPTEVCDTEGFFKMWQNRLRKMMDFMTSQLQNLVQSVLLGGPDFRLLCLYAAFSCFYNCEIFLQTYTERKLFLAL